jgi:outer membrane receptor protein involved in Fe transport
VLTRDDGRYIIQGLQPGGPYTLHVEGMGYVAQSQTDINLTLSQTSRFDFVLEAQAVRLQGLVVTTERDPILNKGRTGAAMTISDSSVSRLPTLTRDFTDFTRLTPQISTQTGGSSAGGRSNRFNSIQIDGAVNNDLFGLGSSAGVPGGSTGARPITLEAIAQFQVVLAPYDVRQGGFTGAGINAITKSGTNEFHGSVTYFGRRNAWTGRYTLPNGNRGPVTGDFQQDDIGFSVGGPIRVDRLHFFLAGENSDRSAPNGGVAIGREASITMPEAQQVADILKNRYGYDPGALGEVTVKRGGLNLFGRIDYSINPDHRLTLRHNRVDAENDELFRANNMYQFGGTLYVGDHLTNSSVLQLNSQFGRGVFNELRLGYSAISDERIPSREPFPFVTVNLPGGNRAINAGTENFSTANALDQKILEITNDVSFARGRHTFTIGTHNELFSFDNIFARNLYGNYTFATVADFDAGIPNRYEFTYLNDGGKPSAAFDVRQLSFYAQDQWDVLDRLTLTAGLRYDVTLLPDEPSFNPDIETAYQRRTDEVPSGNGLFNPRIGFNWNVRGDRSTQVRGGTGLFSGRTPYVWISNAYGNTGVDYTRFTCSTLTPMSNVPHFVADPNAQPRQCAGPTVPVRNEIALVHPDFKLPQVWRSTFAVDQRLPFGFVGTVEGMYTKTRHDVLYRELTLGSVNTTVGLVEGRDVYNRNRPASVETVTDVQNTDEGETANVTVQLQRPFSDRWEFGAAYSFTRARDVTSVISSQAFSSWRRNAIAEDPNNPPLRPSNYEVPHRIVVNGSYRLELLRRAPTDLSLIYVGESGRPYSYTYNGDINSDGSNENDLLYVPRDASEIRFQSASATQPVTPEQSWTNFNNFIERVECLREARGKIVERNACREPWLSRVDVRFAQTLPSVRGHGVEITLDIFNFANLLNRDWGRAEQLGTDRALDPVLRRNGMSVVGGRVLFDAFAPRDPFPVSDLSSRYQIQLGARYAF